MQYLGTYVSFRQNTAAQFIAAKPIMYLFLEAEQSPGPRVS